MLEKEFVEYVAKLLAKEPEEISVEVIEGDKSNVIKLSAHPDDYGRIIGKEGRFINAIRTLLDVVGRESGKRWVINIPSRSERKNSTEDDDDYNRKGD